MRALRLPEKILMMGASALLLGALIWSAWRLRQLPRIESAVVISGSLYSPQAAERTRSPTIRTWSDPSPQPRGPEWIFDLFTPPEIYFNAKTRQFTVITASQLAGDAPRVAGEAFGLRLVKVEKTPFRVQLVGFIGEGDTLAGVFENVATTEHFIARPGQTSKALDELQLTLVTLSLKPKGTGSESTDESLREKLMQATLRDATSADVVCLTTDERVGSAELVATFEADGLESRFVEGHVGDKIAAGGATFQVMHLRLAPPEANLVRLQSGSSEPERRTLTASLAAP